jgi:hypothetical protein
LGTFIFISIAGLLYYYKINTDLDPPLNLDNPFKTINEELKSKSFYNIKTFENNLKDKGVEVFSSIDASKI